MAMGRTVERGQAVHKPEGECYPGTGCSIRGLHRRKCPCRIGTNANDDNRCDVRILVEAEP